MKIASFWNAGRLRNMETLCLASWLEIGAEVDLYHFGPVDGVPKGVNLRPASEILSQDYMVRLMPVLRPERSVWQPVVNYSDLFRVKLMERNAGLWLDCDVLLFRPFAFDPAKPFFAWEDHHRIGSPVFYLPPDSPMIADYLQVLDSPDLMPHWLGLKRGFLRPTIWRLQGKEFSPPDLGITIYGNDAFSRLARKHRLLRHALPRQAFYCWNADETKRFYMPGAPGIEHDPSIIGLHIHHKPHGLPRPDPASLYGRMLAKLAHRLPDLHWAEQAG